MESLGSIGHSPKSLLPLLSRLTGQALPGLPGYRYGKIHTYPGAWAGVRILVRSAIMRIDGKVACRSLSPKRTAPCKKAQTSTSYHWWAWGYRLWSQSAQNLCASVVYRFARVPKVPDTYRLVAPDVRAEKDHPIRAHILGPWREIVSIALGWWTSGPQPHG